VSVVAAHAIRESLRRRVFAVVLVLSVVFLGLYAWGTNELFEDVSGFGGNEFGVDADTLAARPSWAWRCSRSSSSARCWRRS
jgi:hypothetical protein